MVEFMEANGDLSKPSGGPRGRNFIQNKWKDLTNKLNSDGTGDPRPEEKWRKVWSDYKNNTKRKCAKIIQAASGTGGGPALQLSLTDLEKRVMQIIGVQAASGMVVGEAGFQTDEISKASEAQPEELVSEVPSETYEIDWNTPGTSSQPTVAPPPPTEAIPPPTVASPPPTEYHPPSPLVIVDEEWRPPAKKKNKTDLQKLFVESDSKAREYARERDRIYDALEKERMRLRNEELRIRDFELQERVRQRDVELQLQSQWLQFMKEAMEVLLRFMDKKS